ncbi:MAG: hypothetical protein V9E98_00240 [Candidatus Nanopelagicales bacterium]
MGVVALAGVVVLSACSSQEPAAPGASPAEVAGDFKPLPEGTPFDVTGEQLTMHSFHADPETKSGNLRMNCAPLWRAVEKKKGQYDWPLFDLTVAAHQEYGGEYLVYSFCGTPKWAAGKVKDPSVEVFGPKSSAPPKNMQDYEDYVRAVVKRYKGKIQAYEVWNEGSSPQFFQGTPGQLTEMTKILRKVVNEEDPKAIVTMSSMQTHRQDYLDGFVTAYLEDLKQAGWPFDVYNGHFYPPGETGPATRREQISKFREMLADMGAPKGKPLWDTEVNYFVGVPGGEPNGRITGDRAAAWAVRTYLDGWRLDVPRNYWYFATKQYDAFPGIQTRPGDPATIGLATFADWVRGTRFNGCEQKGELVRCAFIKDGKENFHRVGAA